MHKIFLRRFAIFTLMLLLGSCSSVTERPDSEPSTLPDVSDIPDATPRDEPYSKYGNPAQYEVLGKRYYTLKSNQGYKERGKASWYGTKFHGNRTSSGETYDMYAMTAAHKTLPLPTYAEVTNLENGRQVIVKINDRGPFHDDRIIDLSYSAALKLDIVDSGTAKVEVRALTPGSQTKAVPTSASRQQSDDSTQMSAATYLQLAAFSDKSRAEAYKREIESQVTHSVKVVPFQHSQGHLYRVRVGPLDNIANGEQVARQLNDAGYTESHIVIE